jgi:hypothetical protein
LGRGVMNQHNGRPGLARTAKAYTTKARRAARTGSVDIPGTEGPCRSCSQPGTALARRLPTGSIVLVEGRQWGPLRGWCCIYTGLSTLTRVRQRQLGVFMNLGEASRLRVQRNSVVSESKADNTVKITNWPQHRE